MIKFDDVMRAWAEYCTKMKAMDFNLDEEAELIAVDMTALLQYYHDALVRLGDPESIKKPMQAMSIDDWLDDREDRIELAQKAIEGVSDE